MFVFQLFCSYLIPFGLATAVSTFQYFMSKVLTDLNHFTFTYVDDVLIFSKSCEEHLQHLNEVFQNFKCQDTLDYLKEIFCNKPILQFPNPNKDYILYTDVSNNAYSSVLCQPQSDDNDIRPVAYFSGTFTAQNKSWCAMEKEAYAILKSVQRFIYYL